MIAAALTAWLALTAPSFSSSAPEDSTATPSTTGAEAESASAASELESATGGASEMESTTPASEPAEPVAAEPDPLNETKPALLDESVVAAPPASNPTIVNGREYLVPELAQDPFRIEPGRREFLHRLSFSPCAGRLGDRPLYAIRLAYCPSTWLGWEAAVGHNPGQSVHALSHSISSHLRYPLPGRFQPYASLGYGMVLVFPGESLNADPVTSNVLYAGGGCEVFIRGDLALRVEMRSAHRSRLRQRQRRIACLRIRRSHGRSVLLPRAFALNAIPMDPVTKEKHMSAVQSSRKERWRLGGSLPHSGRSRAA